MKIFTGKQIREIDDYTIKKIPISSIDLMERAAEKIFSWLACSFDRSFKMIIVAGPGNNGGDGLAVARMLAESGYRTEVYFIPAGTETSADWQVNRQRLDQSGKAMFCAVQDPDDFQPENNGIVIVDAIFGTGLNRPAEGLAAEIIEKINRVSCPKIAVDIPSGLFPEDNSANNPELIVRAGHTLSFQFPKLAFMFAENHRFTGEWHLLDIGLHPEAIESTCSPFIYPDNDFIRSKLRERSKFSHKGTYGHALLIAGSSSKTGAAILSGKSCLRAGAGLVTCHLPAGSAGAFNCSVPEAMVQTDPDPDIISEVENFNSFTAVGAGPGIGLSGKTAQMILKLAGNCKKPMVLDADALNILSAEREWLARLPENTILTPHPGEFERLAGKCDNGYCRLQKQTALSKELNCIVVLKGAHTSVSLPDGRVCFNRTGNPGMATAGSGDVLTGIILSLLAQGYQPADAAITGVYLHGMAGDIAAQNTGMEALIAGDIIENIGRAYCNLRCDQKAEK